jgi:hypothetical protein
MKQTLQMTIDESATDFEDKVHVTGSYSGLKGFLRSEVGHDVRACENWLAEVQLALGGESVDTGYGNAWKIEIDAETARFHNAYEAPSDSRFEMPTPLLREALERWLAHLLAKGYTRDEMDPR